MMTFCRYCRFPLLLVLVLIVSCRDKSDKIPTVEDELGEVQFIETGELRAVKNTIITLPRLAHMWRQQIIWLEDEGTLVERGDSVVKLENSEILNSLEDSRTDLEIDQADLNKMEVDHQTQLDALKRQIMNARSALQQAVIDTMRVRYEPESSKIRARLQWESKKIALAKAQAKLVATRQLQKEDILIQNLKITQVKARIKELEEALVGTLIRSPASGMVVHAVNRQGRERNKVQVGDQITVGWQLIQLPDMTKMKVLTSVNETDINKIALGDPVMVRLDAFPKLCFRGKIVQVSNICQKKSRDSDIKVFDVEVVLRDTNPLLKPGMTVNCAFHKKAEKSSAAVERDDNGGTHGSS